MDLFAFTRAWWQRWCHKYPDMILGCEAWDMLLYKLMELSCKSGDFQVHAVIYHEKHESFWESHGNRLNNPGQKWARTLAHNWLKEHAHESIARAHFPEVAPWTTSGVVRNNSSGVTVAPTPNTSIPGRAENRTSVFVGNGLAVHRGGPTIAFKQPQTNVAPVIMPPQVSQSPLGRAAVQPKIKAKVRVSDGTRKHLFHNA
jgi:hypothetical protein